MTVDDLDPRVNAIRADLAAAHLRDRIEARRYADGEGRKVFANTAPLRRKPDISSALESELLFGESVTVYEEKDGWAWCQAARDNYVGYTPVSALGSIGPEATHRVSALCSHVYPGPNIKLPPVTALNMNALVSVAEVADGFAALGDSFGYVFSAHLQSFDDNGGDFVSIAEKFIGVTYLWGGRTNAGLDCSALVQLSLQADGADCPRDSDMQSEVLGFALKFDNGLPALMRGDLVFWKGHVGMMLDADMLLHATAHHMMVVAEPLLPTIQRIREASAGEITAIRRL